MGSGILQTYLKYLPSQAELIAILEGLKIAKENHLWPLIIELDVLEVTKLFISDTNIHSNIIAECR